MLLSKTNYCRMFEKQFVLRPMPLLAWSSLGQNQLFTWQDVYFIYRPCGGQINCSVVY